MQRPEAGREITNPAYLEVRFTFDSTGTMYQEPEQIFFSEGI